MNRKDLLLIMGIWLWVLLAAQTASVTYAQQTGQSRQADFPGLDIQAEAGWDGYVDQSAPVPFSFLLSNFTLDTIEGDLSLTDPDSNQTVFLGRLFIGPNNVRRFSAIQAVPNWVGCVAKFSRDGQVLWQRELPLITGQDFSEDINYLLFVDDSGRTLPLPAGADGEVGWRRFIPEAGQGRQVQPLTIKPWQLPQHYGPLTVAQAVVFSEDTKTDTLNDAQWDALGKWCSMGGTIFVSEKSPHLLGRLKQANPLIVQPSMLHKNLAVHRCGSGSLREYVGPLFSGTDPQAPRDIAQSASHLTRCNVISMVESRETLRSQARNAEVTRAWVVIIFVAYMLLSGMAIFLGRLSRRGIMVFTSTVVGTACVAALILGSVLRRSQGDLNWTSVTTVGPGGLVQIARIDVQSAGGRNTQAAVSGSFVDLQLSATTEIYRPRYYYYSYSDSPPSSPHFGAFTWQPNQLKDKPDHYLVDVPINPWGHRRLYATAFQPDVRGIDLKIELLLPGKASDQNQSDNLQVSGSGSRLKVTATSDLPFELVDCYLLAAMPLVTSRSENSGISYASVRQDNPFDFIQSRSITAFGNIAPLATVMVESSPFTTFHESEDVFLSNHQLDQQTMLYTAYDGAVGVWIVGKIAASPALSIDQQHCDFEPMAEEHWFVQEVLPEQLPAEWLALNQAALKQQIERLTDNSGSKNSEP